MNNLAKHQIHKELTEIEVSYQDQQQIKLAILEQLKEDFDLYGPDYVEAIITGYIRGLKWSVQ